MAGRSGDLRGEAQLSAHSLLGLVLLNLFVLAVGAGVLWGIRGWTAWAELLRLSGFAYVLGVAALGVSFVLELVVGLGLSFAVVLLTGAALVAAGLVAARLAGRSLPPPGELSPRLPIVTAVSAGVAILYFEALFRAGRLQGLYSWDAFSFWVPKAKAIYFFGGLDEQFFRELPGPTYPPLVPALESSAFHFMGSADVVTLHLQFWFLFLGFVGAVIGLLGPRVRPMFLWPLVLLVMLSPRVAEHVLAPQGDFLLDELFVVAALLVALWLLERETWQLVAASLLLSAAMLTKREGFVLAACIVVAALVAAWNDRRIVWPRLAVAAAAALAATVPWRIWFSVRDLGGERPEAGATGLASHLDRAWPSFRLTLRTLLDYDLWLLVGPIAVAAIVLAFVAGARLLPGFTALVYALGTAGFTWIVWSFPSLPITQNESVNPVVRVSASLIVLSAAMVPLLLEQAWNGVERRRA